MKIKELADSLADISRQGFKATESVQALVWEREQDDRKEKLIMGYRDYLPGGFYFSFLWVEISFNSVEDIFSRVASMVKFPPNLLVSKGTVSTTMADVEGVDYSVFETEITDADTLERASRQIMEMVTKGALPFLSTYSTIEAVHKKVESMEVKNIATFLKVPIPFRRMILKKLVNDPDFEGYSNMVIDYYKKENDPVWKIAEKFYNELTEPTK